MGSLSRLSRVSTSTAAAADDDCCIYAPFCTKNSTTNISTVIDCYTPSTNSWNRTTSIPEFGENLVLRNFAMVSLNHHIYIIGGRLSGKHSNVTADERIVPCVRRYNLRTDTWETCAPMSKPRFNFACTVGDENKIYVAGGQTSLCSAKGTSSAEVYDPALDQWRSLADMSTTRSKCVGVTWQGRIHVVGGFVGGGGPFVMTRSSAEVYDPRRDAWEVVPRMWELDCPPNQIVVVDGKLFSSGDCLKPWKGHIENYDEKEKIWNVVPGSHFDGLSSPAAMHQRLYLTMTNIGSRLYFLAAYGVLDGEDSMQRSEVHVFDTEANGDDGWWSFEPVEEEGEKQLCGHCCVVKQQS